MKEGKKKVICLGSKFSTPLLVSSYSARPDDLSAKSDQSLSYLASGWTPGYKSVIVDLEKFRQRYFAAKVNKIAYIFNYF